MSDKGSNTKLFVGNLTYKVDKNKILWPFKIGKEDLNQLFRPYGDIVDIKVIDKGRFVYAFVEFSQLGDAEEAYRE